MGWGRLLMLGLVRWGAAWLERFAPRGLIMVLPCVVGFNIWRGQPYPEAHTVNALGVMGIILALAAFRMAPREAVSTALLCLLGVVAATLATDAGQSSNVARIFIGGLFLVAAVAAWSSRADLWDTALAIGLWSEAAAWLLGNSARGTFGADVAMSAIGQAYGAWAQPAQWGLIVAVYAYAWYNHKATAA